MSKLTRTIARVSTGVVVAGVLVGGAAPAFADTPTSHSPALRTVAVSAPLDAPAQVDTRTYQDGLRQGSYDGNRDGYQDAKDNCKKDKAENNLRALTELTAFDQGYKDGYTIGYEKGYNHAEQRFCHNDKGENGRR
jgi:hypothetical protein